MKKLILITVLWMLLFSGCFIFDYNGNATIIIRNIGELTMFARIETGYTVLPPGEEDTFKLTWPGHDDMNVNLITYPENHPELGENQNFDISDGEERLIQKGYYLEDLNTAKK